MIVGVDVSSRAIHLAWLENGKPQRWHQELAKGHLIDRLRSIDIRWPRDRETLMPGTEDGPHIIMKRGLFDPVQSDVTDVAIEYPFGRGNAIAALMSTVGVITRQAPPWARVAWPSSQELRAAIGAKNTKDEAHRRLIYLAVERGWKLVEWDEHELDALTACIGWTRILEQQDAA